MTQAKEKRPFPQEFITVRRVEKLTLFRNFYAQLIVKLHSVIKIPKPWPPHIRQISSSLCNEFVAIFTAIAYTDLKSNYTKAGYPKIKIIIEKKLNKY